MRRKATWYVTYVLCDRGISQRYRRQAKHFENEEDAKSFASARLADARNLLAGTLNPHVPKRIIGSLHIVDWLNEASQGEVQVEPLKIHSLERSPIVPNPSCDFDRYDKRSISPRDELALGVNPSFVL